MDRKQLHECAKALRKKAQAVRTCSEQLRVSAHQRCHEIDAYVRDVWIGQNTAGRHVCELVHSCTQHVIPQAERVQMAQKATQMFKDAEHMYRRTGQKLKAFYRE